MTTAGVSSRGVADHSPRDRIVYAAAQALRHRGISGTGLRGLVADAGSPWGSLQHYFPGGKDQVVAEALDWAGELAGERVRAYLATAAPPTPYGLFCDLVDTWIDDLAAVEFRLGCPVVGAVADGLDPDSAVEAAGRRALAAWRTPVTDGLVATGVAGDDAADLATTLLACAEGAILIARLERSTAPLEAVKRSLRPLLVAA